MKDAATIATVLAALLMSFDGPARAQSSAEIDYYNSYYGRYVSSLSGGRLSVEVSDTPEDFTKSSCEKLETVCGHWEGTLTAAVLDLDLDQVEIEEGCCDEFGLTSEMGFGMLIGCREGATCVSQENGRFTGFDPPPIGGGMITQLVVSCSSFEECAAFLDVLRGREEVAGDAAEDTAAEDVAGDVAEDPAGDVAEDVAPAAQPSVPDRPASDTGFHDVLDGISWRNGSSSSALDELLRKTRPTTEPPRPASQQPTFVAFAQSAGFDANGGYGYAIGTDLNSTVGWANAECAARAKTSCADEGYCMLKPGLWGAWASDLKYIGSKAFTCNLSSEDEARNRAQAWCGEGCKVLWTGVGQ